jgi:hypothetical protein
MQLALTVLGIAAIAPQVWANCCYKQTMQAIASGTADLDILASSTEGYSSGSYDVTLTFPGNVNTDQPTPLTAGISCARSTRTIDNQWQCTGPAKEQVAIRYRLVATRMDIDPQLTVSVAGQICSRAAAGRSCPDPSKPPVGPTPTEPSKPVGIDLGPLGFVQPEVFWPVLTVCIIAVVGMAALVYKRNIKKRVTTADEERQMASGGNGAGWFGEKKPKMTGNALPTALRSAGSGKDMPKSSGAGKKTTSKTASASRPSSRPSSKNQVRRESSDSEGDLEAQRAAARQQRAATKVVPK